MEKASGNPKYEKDKFLIMKKATMDTTKYFKMRNKKLIYQKHMSKMLKETDSYYISLLLNCLYP